MNTLEMFSSALGQLQAMIGQKLENFQTVLGRKSYKTWEISITYISSAN